MRKGDCKWLEKLNHGKNMDGKIDGVRKHTYNLELDFRLIGKAREEACVPHAGAEALTVFTTFSPFT